jgi:hypothetical protein
MEVKGAYKRTGNIAVDMVAACIYHYEYYKKKLLYIRLHPDVYKMFIEYVVDKIPMYDLSDETVEFDGVKVTKGSSLMTENMYFEVEKEAPKIFLMN